MAGLLGGKAEGLEGEGEELERRVKKRDFFSNMSSLLIFP